MAKLHGRIRRLSDTRVKLAKAALAVCLAALPCAAHAERAAPAVVEAATALPELGALTEALGASDPGQREEALDHLLTLDSEAYGALRAHLRSTHALGDQAAALRASLAYVQRMRAGAGSEAKLKAVLLRALESDPSPAMRHAVELHALIQALEAERTRAAADVLLELLAVEQRGLRTPVLRAMKRLGRRALVPLLRARAAPDPATQRLARDALVALRAQSVDAAFEQAEPDEVADLLAVYGEQRERDALPWAVAYLQGPDPILRSAAARALSSYGEAALPTLSDLVATRTGIEPAADATASQLLRQLVEELGRSASSGADALARAEAALKTNDLAAAERALDESLNCALSTSETLRAGALYAQAAAKHDAQNRSARALMLYRRALRLGAEEPGLTAVRARALYLEAELRLWTGIADVPTLAQAAKLDPKLSAAHELLDELTGARRERERTLERRVGLAAAGMLALAALLVLLSRRSTPPPAVS
jgi:hypothetical protein